MRAIADRFAPVRAKAQPFLKWAGGKSAIAARITSLLPADLDARVYREPFLGGAAMFFHLQPERAVLGDALVDLIAAYTIVQNAVEPLITRLEALAAEHSTEQFYAIRERFNTERDASAVERASWLVYMNRTCFNGLYRTNRSGYFNVPIGKYKNPRIADPSGLRLASAVLSRATLVAGPFERLLEDAEPGDVIYLDPPYVPLSKTSNFASYSPDSFSEADQARLADVFRALDERGCLLALSNSDTPLVRELYRGFDVTPIIAPRAISSKASTRGDVNEVLVRNVARWPST